MSPGSFFIIFLVSLNCFTMRFTSAISTPAPFAIRCFLDGFSKSGFLLSSTVIDCIIASILAIFFSFSSESSSGIFLFPIPGNEKSVTKIVNGLLLLGAEVIYESMYDVHVSGHACQEEQKLMLTLTRPKYFLPVHGEYKQLKKHALTAASLGIPTSNILIAENGSNVILTRDEIKLGEPVTAGAVMVDGLGVGDVGNVVLRDRKHLSEDGLVIIVATVDSKTGKVLAGPDLVSRGFVYVRENESLMDGAQSIVENALDRCVDEHVRDWNSVKTRVREALSSYIYRRTKRSPMILPILMEV